MPLEFLSSGAVAGVLQCAALAARLDHREANSSVMKFLYDLTRAANNARADRERIRSQCFPYTPLALPPLWSPAGRERGPA